MTNYLYLHEDKKETEENKGEQSNLKKVLYGIKTKDYNPETHVKVRVLYHDDFPVNLDNGLLPIDTARTIDSNS